MYPLKSRQTSPRWSTGNYVVATDVPPGWPGQAGGVPSCVTESVSSQHQPAGTASAMASVPALASSPQPSTHPGTDQRPPEDGPSLEERLRRGDEGALAEVYQQFAPAMFSAAFRLLGNREDAAEAVQQAFFQAWRGAQRLEGRSGGLQPWLHAITRRAAIDLYRRERRGRWNTSLSEPATESLLAIPGPSLEDSWRAWQVRSALVQLPARERQVLKLAYFHQMTQTEIAGHLGVPIGTVKSRTARAQQRLAALLAHLRDEAPAEAS
ncbi:RNA polymerase sigma factor [Micromonospora sp. NPDC000089]|uniref:RNA polymerase sigma factor n=1 Tax=unclassified Micromonospora TaxID=2617518 RepID=UPI0036CADA72